MAVASQKTFFAAPNFDYTPDGLIQLGQIIIDHKAPGKAICGPHEPLPKTYSSHFDDWEQEKTRALNGSVGIFAQCLAVLLGFGADISVNFAKEDDTLLKFRKLETFVIEPSRKYIEASMRMAPVQDFLLENPKSHSLFMITGIKIARGAECTKRRNRTGGVEGTASVDLTNTTGVPVSVGSQGSLSRRREHRETFSGSSDFIFAYRLCRVSVRRKTGTISSEDFVKGAVYAHDSKTEEKSGSQLHSKASEADGDNTGERELWDDFEFGGEDADFASTFVPQGFKAVSVESENNGPCRLVFQRWW